ncbi:hypothetical protein VTK26DRAFT_2076 [Humicola hyalothermophila]
MNDARLRALLSGAGAPSAVKLVLHPKHGGAVLEFADAAAAGRAALVVQGIEIDGGGGSGDKETGEGGGRGGGGRKLRTGTVAELFRQRGEKRVDWIDGRADASQGKDRDGREKDKDGGGEKGTKTVLPPPPSLLVRRPGAQRAGPKRGLGFVGAVTKKDVAAAAATTVAAGPGGAGGARNGGGVVEMGAGGGKSNADFKRLFLGGGNTKESGAGEAVGSNSNSLAVEGGKDGIDG